MGINRFSGELMCLAQGHSTVPPAEIKPRIYVESNALTLCQESQYLKSFIIICEKPVANPVYPCGNQNTYCTG